MIISYFQDQEIYRNGNRIYHPKSKMFFNRYLSGLTSDDRFYVTSFIVDTDSEELNKYQEITDSRIIYKSIPNFKKIANYFKIIEVVKKQVGESDFCYIRTGMSGIIAAHYCRKKQIPYMFIVNEDIEKNLKTHRKPIVRISSGMIGMAMRHYIHHADYSCYVTQNYLQKRYPCNGKTLGCSDIDNLVITEDSRIAYSNRRRNGNSFSFGTVGSVDTPLKGQDTVVTVMKMLKEKGINVKYQLVGNGSGNWIKKIAEELGVLDNVEFVGVLPREKVLTWMKTLDVYIQPSKSEGLPRAIIEAMSCSVPCIAADVGGISELIPSKYLFSHGSNSTEQLYNIVLSLSDSELKKMSLENFEKSKDYDPIILDKKRESFFSEAINRTRKSIGGRMND